MKVAGFGFRSGASLASLQDALARAGGSDGLTMIATAKDKAAMPVFQAMSSALDLPITAVPQDQIEAASVTTRSAKSQLARGTGSLSEAAALAAAGPSSNLTSTRVISADKMATCAIATGGTP